MELFTLLKIDIVIFGLVNWISFKTDLAQNKEILDERLNYREPIRKLTSEKLKLL
jgi:hypothetical protein